jgi:hypothetical protein
MVENLDFLQNRVPSYPANEHPMTEVSTDPVAESTGGAADNAMRLADCATTYRAYRYPHSHSIPGETGFCLLFDFVS